MLRPGAFAAFLALGVLLTGQDVPSLNYAEALQKSVFFYDVQRSGHLPASNRVNWRGDSALNDGADHGVDLTGGWYDAGDHVKFGFPMAGSATLLAWGLLEYRSGFESTHQLQPALDNLRWATDYFLKASATPGVLWGQVGNGGADHSWWGPAEVLPMDRPSYMVSSTCPGSDLAAETAAALAASSMVFTANGDPTYAATLLARARSLYTFASDHLGVYSDCITDADAYYHSFSGYADELVWGALWLYQATSEQSYLATAEQGYAQIANEPGKSVKGYTWTHNWDDKSYGSFVLLARITGTQKYRTDAERWLDYWTSGYNGERIRYTPGGLAWLDQWGPLRYAANTAFLAFVYSDWLDKMHSDPTRADRYRTFGESQINYMLGRNPRSSSYLIGFGQNPPKNPHHRTAHGSWENNIAVPTETSHVLYGALVGGPDLSDNFGDERGNYVTNEVATDYNAAFTGALARMVESYGGQPLAQFPVAETPSRDELFVEAGISDEGPDHTEIAVVIRNESAWPARETRHLKLRYFFTLEGGDASKISVSSPATECGNATGPALLQDTVYYVEVSCEGQRIYPGGQSESRRQVRFRITSTGTWNASNDWSYENLAPLGSPPQKVQHIALYDGDTRVWGREPFGAADPLAIQTEALPGVTVGTATSFTLTAVGGLPPYSGWLVVDGALPAGIVLQSSTGQLTGAPSQAGASTFTVQVQDAAGMMAQKELTWEIEAAPVLQVLVTRLVAAIVNLPYAAGLHATGGTQPYSWTVDGSLPAGLQLSGDTISGTPTFLGSVSFTARVTDATGASATGRFQIQVVPPPVPTPGKVRLEYRTYVGNATSNQIAPQFRLTNDTSSNVPLSELTVRYYFTIDGDRPLQYWCDWTPIGCDHVTARFVDYGRGSYYLELGFTADAGLLVPGKDTGEIQNRFAKDNWSDFNQTNDYSFDASKTVFALWDHVLLYRNGELVSGAPPGSLNRDARQRIRGDR